MTLISKEKITSKFKEIKTNLIPYDEITAINLLCKSIVIAICADSAKTNIKLTKYNLMHSESQIKVNKESILKLIKEL